MIKFVRAGTREDCETLYRLEKDGEVLREGITLDEVIYAINRMDEERAGLRGTDCHTSAAALVRNDRLTADDPSPASRELPLSKGSKGRRPPHTADREPEVRRGRGV